MRELAVQASNDTNVTTDRNSIKEELTALASEIDKIASQTQFNTKDLFSAASTTVTLQVGANKDQTISVTFSQMSSTALTVNNVANSVDTSANATGAIDTINKAIESVSKERSKLGAVQNRLEHTVANLNNASENLQAAESRVRDVDMAKEMMSYSKNNILQQAAQAMIAQANQQPQNVLQLLR
jgi:flagellin